jgi:CspA family cold shock protein
MYMVMMQGKVKWFDENRGAGLIRAENGRDLMVHFSDLQGTGFRVLAPGEHVAFEVMDTPKGPVAVNVHNLSQGEAALEPFIPDGYCLQCRGCCFFAEELSPWSPYLCDEEAARLAADPDLRLQITPAKSIRLVPDGPDYWCVFLQKSDHACQIYGRRPFECRLYPFLLARKKSEDFNTKENIFLAADPYCPYVKDMSGTEIMTAYTDRLAAYLEHPTQYSIIQANPHIIHPYAEVLYLKELYASHHQS